MSPTRLFNKLKTCQKLNWKWVKANGNKKKIKNLEMKVNILFLDNGAKNFDDCQSYRNLK